MSAKTVNKEADQTVSPRHWIRLVVVYLLIPLILFICGGDLDWWQAWLYSLLILAAGIGGRMWAEQRHPGITAERQDKESFHKASFFSSVVRIQTDRGHVVCDSGPYRFVRHPGYAGSIFALFGIVLALGSVWTLIPAAVASIIAVIRTVLEDQTLQEELPGYRDYAQRVRYRLIPRIY